MNGYSAVRRWVKDRDLSTGSCTVAAICHKMIRDIDICSADLVVEVVVVVVCMEDNAPRVFAY